MIFRNWVLENFPFLEDDFDALTDYELFCKMMEYVKEFAKDNEEFKKQLDEYKNYFDNLDVQEEINNKLDEMALDGTLENLIGQYIELATTYVYNSVSEMKSATNLVNGSFARTSGFYFYNDGGGAYYKIRTITNDDVVDEMFIIALADNSLIAELLVNDILNVKQCGVKPLVTEDSTSKLTSIFAKGYDIYLPSGTYNITSNLTLISHKLIGEDYNNTIIKNNNNANIELLNVNEINKLMIKNICFDCGELTDLTKTAVNLYDSEDISIIDCEFKNGYGSHIRSNGNNNVLIENCYFHDITGTSGNMGNGIYCHPSSNVTITKCRCNNMKEDFIYLDGEDDDPIENVYINNCYIKNTGHENTETSANAIGVNGNCKNVIISNNVITNNINGIKFAERYSVIPQNVYIYNNIINNNTQNGMNVEGDNINIYENVVYTNGQDGIYVKNSSNIHINNNTVYSCTRNGVYTNNSNYISINNCIIYDNTSTGLLVGVNSSNPCNHVLINSCSVYKTTSGTQATGIQVIYGSDIQITACKSYNNSSYDWDVQRGTITDFLSQLNPNTRQSDTVRNITYASTTPTDGTYKKGDIVLFSSPNSGGYIGAVCVTAGTPGTWKDFGSISS